MRLARFHFHRSGLAVGAAPDQLYLTVQHQFARRRIVVRTYGFPFSTIEFKSGQAISEGFSGLTLHAHAGRFDDHQSPGRRRIGSDAHGDLDFAFGKKDALRHVELSLGALHVVIFGAVFVGDVDDDARELLFAFHFLKIFGMNGDHRFLISGVSVGPLVRSGNGAGRQCLGLLHIASGL